MNHADPGTMRARARQAIEILKTQLLRTGTVEALVALYFDDHIEQVQFEDPSVRAMHVSRPGETVLCGRSGNQPHDC